MPPPDFAIAIPARFGASRLPGKPLRLLGGEPLVRHVVRRAIAAGAAEVVLATDDDRIAAAVDGLPVAVCMTRADHASGTDRLAEVAATRAWPDELPVLNLQGDEPFVPVDAITATVAALVEGDAPMATLATPMEDIEALFDPNVVKVVRDGRGRALYFSRAPIPWHRDRYARERLGGPAAPCLRHIGLYAYRAGFLARFAALPPGRLEALEALEQLRVLEAGHSIAVAISPSGFPPGIDTEADLARAEATLRGA
ncbi:MAG: 3-deoxy-manno-octulosonate cytidylyltransferase [Lysobacteraceae bacterium]|jgi:3-deoxy-manno-octulosonate cytidylyltransferase (CMP-KDO synthetase)|nr:3-deoxy-manno-octulosonate cytidylyltransferase [Silanimonas sp.]